MLHDFVETLLSAEEIGDLLTMAGFELEGIEEVEGMPVLDIKVMSNRGDGLSVFGLAREVLAKDQQAKPTALYNQAKNRFADLDDAGTEVHERTSAQVEADSCSRFVVRMIEGQTLSSNAPEWLQQRLRQAGMRPISLIVDVTNYVMLELGQPLHAYDFNKLKGNRLVVRNAKNGEKITTLNGDEHELCADQMMICDAENPVGVAGVMGGLDSEVGEGTEVALLESAHFLNTSVRRTRKQLGLSTEASYRFERSVDPEGTLAATHRVLQLLHKCDSSIKVVPGTIDLYPKPVQPSTIEVRVSRANKLLGLEVTNDEAEGYLERLGFDVTGTGEPFYVQSPSWRPDIVREQDLVEEIGRVHGFYRIPESLPLATTTRGGVSRQDALTTKVRQLLLRLGFDQTISHSLRGEHALDNSHGRIGPRTPSSPDMALLRNSLLPSLTESSRRNGGRDIHLFEIGRCFWQEHGEPVERTMLGILSQGNLFPINRSSDFIPQADFFSLKGVLGQLMPTMIVEAPLEPDLRLHPTRQASVPGVGIFGQIHPDIAEKALIPTDTVLAELDLERLLELTEIEVPYKPLSRNPSVRRDIAILVSKSLPYSQIENALDLACGDLLERQWLFDVYEGKGIPEDKHSLAIALQLRKVGENFTDEEANQVREKAVAALEVLGAKLRG